VIVMKKQRIVASVLTVMFMAGFLTWMYDWFWHYPTPRHVGEEPAAADG